MPREMDWETSGNVSGEDIDSIDLTTFNVDRMILDSPTAASTPAAADGESSDLNAETMDKFRRDAARAFFNEHGLIGHQISSYNDFLERGIQDLFDSLGEVAVDPGYDPSNKSGGAWRRATVSYGKVTLEKPSFWSEKEDILQQQQNLKLLPRHARLQNITYAAQLQVEARVQVFTQEISDKAKTGTPFVYKNVQSDETKELVVGRLPVMVKSKLCWLNNVDKKDRLFDHGGYFLIKGMEKGYMG